MRSTILGALVSMALPLAAGCALDHEAGVAPDGSTLAGDAGMGCGPCVGPPPRVSVRSTCSVNGRPAWRMDIHQSGLGLSCTSDPSAHVFIEIEDALDPATLPRTFGIAGGTRAGLCASDHSSCLRLEGRVTVNAFERGTMVSLDYELAPPTTMPSPSVSVDDRGMWCSVEPAGCP